MSPIDPIELSAYLDGELSEDRRRAVAEALASDPALRAEYEALAGADAAWRHMAQHAAFTSSVRWPREDVPLGLIAAVFAVLVGLKLLTSFADGVVLVLVVHTAAFAAALAGITWLVRSPMRSTSTG